MPSREQGHSRGSSFARTHASSALPRDPALDARIVPTVRVSGPRSFSCGLTVGLSVPRDTAPTSRSRTRRAPPQGAQVLPTSRSTTAPAIDRYVDRWRLGLLAARDRRAPAPRMSRGTAPASRCSRTMHPRNLERRATRSRRVRDATEARSMRPRARPRRIDVVNRASSATGAALR